MPSGLSCFSWLVCVSSLSLDGGPGSVVEYTQWARYHGYGHNPARASLALLELYAEEFLRLPDADVHPPPPPRHRQVLYAPEDEGAYEADSEGYR